jgi:hypothetical protein
MNPEVLRVIPKRMITNPEVLGRVCWNLSNQLTSGRWNSRSVRDAGYSHSQTERLGFYTLSADSEIEPIYNRTNVDFYASKDSIEEDGGKVFDFATYRLMMSISQSVDQTEIPPVILDEIFAAKDEDSDYNGVLEDVNRDDMSIVEMMRGQTVTYEITDEGEIESHALSFEYTFDKETVYEMQYDSSEGVRITAPIKIVGTGEVVDERPVIYTSLTNAQIESETKNLDESWVRFIGEMAFKEITSFNEQDQYQHRHQALAMIGLLGSGIFSLRDLARAK